jgi:hypothetical protein
MMERLFSPCTRLQDVIEENFEEFRDHPEGFQEVDMDLSPEDILSAEGLQELNLDVSTPELLSNSAIKAFTHADL